VPIEGDLALTDSIERIVQMTGYRAVQICWMRGLV